MLSSEYLHTNRVVYDDSSSSIGESAPLGLPQLDPESNVNLPPAPTSGYREKSDDDSKFTRGLRAILAVSIVSALVVMAIEAFMYAAINLNRHDFESDSKYSEISIYLALFIFASVYLVVITVVGLHTKNMIVLSMLCVFYACMLIYTGIQYQELSQNGVNFKSRSGWELAVSITNIVAIAVLGVTFLLQALFVYVLKGSVRWYKFKKIGASFEIKRYYTIFQIHRCLLMFDFFFFLAFTVQFIVIMVNDKTSLEFILTCCMLPLTLLVLFASDYAATREFVWLSICSIICFVAGCVYVLFKIVRLFTRYTSAFDLTVRPGSYFPGRTSLFSFGIITLVFLFSTIAAEILTVYNYNKGLLPLVNTYYGKLPKAGHRGPHSTTEFDFDEGSEKAADNDSILID